MKKIKEKEGERERIAKCLKRKGVYKIIYNYSYIKTWRPDSHRNMLSSDLKLSSEFLLSRLARRKPVLL